MITKIETVTSLGRGGDVTVTVVEDLWEGRRWGCRWDMTKVSSDNLLIQVDLVTGNLR